MSGSASSGLRLDSEKPSVRPGPFDRATDPNVNLEIRAVSGPSAHALQIEQARIVLEILQWLAAQSRPEEFLRTG